MADPDKQFMLLVSHIQKIRSCLQWANSPLLVFVESNLGYESEHHERALRGMHKVNFYRDLKRGRVGVTTTLPVKHAAVTLTQNMLMEGRIALADDVVFVSSDPKTVRQKLREQLEIYSYQFKTATTVFGKDQMALSGKVGGMKDDVCICLQMCIYHSARLFSAATE